MTTTQFSVAPSNIGTNGKTSPAINLPANTYEVNARLVAPNWFTTTGTVTYRVDIFLDGAWVSGGGSIDPIPMGSTARDGGLPILGFSTPDLPRATQLRVFVQCSKTFSIGADVTVLSDFVPS